MGYMPICGEKEYYLACACGELYVPPSAYVSLLGLTVQQSFLRGNVVLLLFVKNIHAKCFTIFIGMMDPQ